MRRRETTRGKLQSQKRLQFKVIFTTAGNLPALARSSFSLHAEATFCDGAEDYDYVAFGPVYWRDRELDNSQIAADALAAAGGLQTYYFYANVLNEHPSLKKGVPLQSYDLRTSPKDLCFRITMPEYPIGGSLSNRVTIPRAALVEALRLAPPEFQMVEGRTP